MKTTLVTVIATVIQCSSAIAGGAAGPQIAEIRALLADSRFQNSLEADEKIDSINTLNVIGNYTTTYQIKTHYSDFGQVPTKRINCKRVAAVRYNENSAPGGADASSQDEVSVLRISKPVCK